jgi:uncharacterized protein (TIGR03435 family)
VSLVFEQRPTDVYVLSAPAGQTAAIRSADQGADDVGVGFASSYMSITASASEMPEPQSMAARIPQPEAWRRATPGNAVGRLTITNETMETFCFELEQLLDRPVVDETGLSGRYDIELPEQTGGAAIATRLKDELGLTLTEDRRDVRVLIVKSQ